MSVNELVKILKNLPKDSVIYDYQIRVATSKDSALTIKSGG